MTDPASPTASATTPPKANLISRIEAVILLLHAIKTAVQAMPAAIVQGQFNAPSAPAETLAADALPKSTQTPN